jgi:hypothetical protein
MSTLTELLAEARRRALLTGTPLSSSEMTGITDAAAAGAGQRVALKQRLLEEKKRIAREKKMAKQAMATQERNDKIEGMGNVYQIDQMTGKHLSNATGGYGTDLIKTGATKLADAMGATPYINQASRKMGNLTGNLVGNTTAGLVMPTAANAIPGVTAGTMQTQIVNPAVQTMMEQIGAKGATTLATQGTGQIAGNTAGQAAGVAGQGVGATAGKIVGAVTPVLNIVGAADAARNIWGGDLSRPYAEAGWSQKIARTPLASTGVPGFGASESELASSAFGKNNPITKVNNLMGKVEEEVVGKPLDKIFGAVGKVISKICFAIGTPVTMEDGTERKIEELRLYDNMKEGGSVWGTGTCLSEDMWKYKGLFVSGEHAVLENGQWVRISQSEHGRKLTIDEPMVVVPIANENHVMIVNGMVFSDYAETDHGTDVNDAFRLDYMNSETDKINYLMDKYELRAAA